MIPISIRDLADITSGEVCLGHPPPLSGLDEPLIGRVVVDIEQVGEGDLFWQLPCNGRHDPGDVANDAWMVAEATVAFSRGAAGVLVQTECGQPWAGQFALRVADSSWALWQLAKESRQQFAGRVVGVAGDADNPTLALVRAMLNEPCLPQTGVRNAVQFTSLQLVNQTTSKSVTLPLPHECPTQLDALSHLTQPDFIIADSRVGHELSHWRNCLPDDGALIVWGKPGKGWGEHFAHGSCDLLSVGRHAGSFVRASRIGCSGSWLLFSVEGCRVSLPGFARDELNYVLSAWAIARRFGISDSEIARRICGFSPPIRKLRRTEVDGISVIHDTSPHTCDTWFDALCRGGEFAGSSTPRLTIHDPSKQPTFPSGAHHSRHVVVNCRISPGKTAINQQTKYRTLAKAIVQQCGADTLFTFGPAAQRLADLAIQAGMPTRRTVVCGSRQTTIDQVRTRAKPEDLVVILGDDPTLLTTGTTRLTPQQFNSNRKAA